MISTIDAAGRVVIPRAIRSQLGWEGGEEIEILEGDGIVEIRPVPTKMTLVETGDGLVAIPERELPQLTGDIVAKTRDATRR